MHSQFLDSADINKGVGTYCPYPTRETSRIAFKDNNPHQRICRKPLRAVQTNDVVLTIFTAEKFYENFINEDDFNNTFLFKISFLAIAGSELCQN